MNNVDVIIIGAGINSLVVASILSKAGKNILLLESREKIGGMASTEEFARGFKCNIINDSIKWIDPRLLKKFNLASKGLELIQPDIVRTALDYNYNQTLIIVIINL